jgi:O-antigen/teichoic acid export membrane protein
VLSAALGAGFLVVFGRSLLTLVSPQFVDAYPALIVLSIVHLFNSAIIVISAAMNMCHLQVLILKSQVMGIAIGVPLMFVFSSNFGVVGVATAVLVAIIVNFLSLVIYSVKAFRFEHS